MFFRFIENGFWFSVTKLEKSLSTKVQKRLKLLRFRLKLPFSSLLY